MQKGEGESGGGEVSALDGLLTLLDPPRVRHQLPMRASIVWESQKACFFRVSVHQARKEEVAFIQFFSSPFFRRPKLQSKPDEAPTNVSQHLTCKQDIPRRSFAT